MTERGLLGTFSTIPTAKSESWVLGVQEHTTVRSGGRAHYDLRLAPPGGPAYSWAVPKAKFPEIGSPQLLAVRVEDHDPGYMSFSGKLGEGYGHGTVKLVYLGQVDVLESGPFKLWFVVHDGMLKGEYKLFRRDEKLWGLINVTKTKDTAGIIQSRPNYKEVKVTQAKKLLDDDSIGFTPKVDGAHAEISLKAGDLPRVYSYREPKGGNTGVIEHTFKYLPAVQYRVPKDLDSTVLRGELFARDKETGKALPPEEIGGMVNAKTIESRRKQGNRGPLDLMYFDVAKYKGKPAKDLPYEAKHRILKDVAMQLGFGFVPPLARTTEEKRRMLEDIKSGRVPETQEGVVAYRMDEPGAPVKVKFRPDYDVYIRGIFTKPKSFAKGEAGGFTFGWDESAKDIAGRIGTGFIHQMRKEMLTNPEDYIGRVAKVEAQGVYKKDGKPGALRAPSFIGWHLEKGKQDV